MDQSQTATGAASLEYSEDDSSAPENNDTMANGFRGVLGTKSKGILDDDDEEEVEANLDVGRIQNFHNFPPDTRPGLSPAAAVMQHSLHGDTAPPVQYAPGFDTHGHTAHPGDTVIEGEGVAFGVILEEERNGNLYREDGLGRPSAVSRSKAATAHSIGHAVPAHVETSRTPPRTRRRDMTDSYSLNSLGGDTSSTGFSAAGRTGGDLSILNNRSSFSEGEHSSLDSAVRRARNNMLAFQQKDGPMAQLRPEELPPPPCPVGPQEPALPHKTSRKCLERIRRRPGEQYPATLVTGTELQKRPSLQEQQRFICVICENCQLEMLVEKTAVVVACPKCRSVTAASDTLQTAMVSERIRLKKI